MIYGHFIFFSVFKTEMFKDDVLSERKDRERAQAQREKLRRDLEILQSRNQSLQEQVTM